MISDAKIMIVLAENMIFLADRPVGYGHIPYEKPMENVRPLL